MKLISIVIVLALLCVTPVIADTRAEEIQKQYQELLIRRNQISEELLRLEGAYRELTRKEETAEVKAPDEEQTP